MMGIRPSPRGILLLAAAIAAAIPLGILLASSGARAQEDPLEISIGKNISPVPLDLTGKDLNLVYLGSYIVNAQAACNECHVGSTPANQGLYLAGGSDGPN